MYELVQQYTEPVKFFLFSYITVNSLWSQHIFIVAQPFSCHSELLYFLSFTECSKKCLPVHIFFPLQIIFMISSSTLLFTNYFSHPLYNSFFFFPRWRFHCLYVLTTVSHALSLLVHCLLPSWLELTVTFVIFNPGIVTVSFSALGRLQFQFQIKINYLKLYFTISIYFKNY